MTESNAAIDVKTGTVAQVKSAYDRMSWFYDIFASKAEKKLPKTALRLVDIQPGYRVLEFGFGTGIPWSAWPARPVKPEKPADWTFQQACWQLLRPNWKDATYRQGSNSLLGMPGSCLTATAP
jgi:hypothetical protein